MGWCSALSLRHPNGECGLRDYQTGDSREIGSEKTPQEYVDKMVRVFHEVYRVLRDDGTLWLNLGDSYSGNGGYAGDEANERYLAKAIAAGKNPSGISLKSRGQKMTEAVRSFKANCGLKSGNLAGIPWRVALALQADGWILRQDIIWHKPSPMPESVKNRCTKAHEYIFLLAKHMGYFYDAEAIKTDAEPSGRTVVEGGRKFNQNSSATFGKNPTGNSVPGSVVRTGNKANKRSVWTIAGQGYDGAHFAVYPPKLIELMIKAGTSEKGCCARCGETWKRVVEEKKLIRDRPNDYVKRRKHAEVMPGPGSSSILMNTCSNSVAGVEVKTVGWGPTCRCGAEEVVPCTVLDPFLGSGTTAEVCLGLGRRCMGIDLSREYLEHNAVVRIEGAILSRPGLVHLLPSRDGK